MRPGPWWLCSAPALRSDRPVRVLSVRPEGSFSRGGRWGFLMCADVSGFGLWDRAVEATTVLELFGEIDIEAQLVLGPAVQRIVDRKAPEVVVDLRPVTFMDAGGLRLLGEVQDGVAARGGTLRLVRGRAASCGCSGSPAWTPPSSSSTGSRRPWRTATTNSRCPEGRLPTEDRQTPDGSRRALDGTGYRHPPGPRTYGGRQAPGVSRRMPRACSRPWSPPPAGTPPRGQARPRPWGAETAGVFRRPMGVLGASVRLSVVPGQVPGQGRPRRGGAPRGHAPCGQATQGGATCARAPCGGKRGIGGAGEGREGARDADRLGLAPYRRPRAASDEQRTARSVRLLSQCPHPCFGRRIDVPRLRHGRGPGPGETLDRTSAPGKTTFGQEGAGRHTGVCGSVPTYGAVGVG